MKRGASDVNFTPLRINSFAMKKCSSGDVGESVSSTEISKSNVSFNSDKRLNMDTACWIARPYLTIARINDSASNFPQTCSPFPDKYNSDSSSQLKSVFRFNISKESVSAELSTWSPGSTVKKVYPASTNAA